MWGLVACFQSISIRQKLLKVWREVKATATREEESGLVTFLPMLPFQDRSTALMVGRDQPSCDPSTGISFPIMTPAVLGDTILPPFGWTRNVLWLSGRELQRPQPNLIQSSSLNSSSCKRTEIMFHPVVCKVKLLKTNSSPASLSLLFSSKSCSIHPVYCSS